MPEMSRQFKSWFGNSVVVNPDGTPKVCYHGTSPKIKKGVFKSDIYRGGIIAFFSEDPKMVDNYASQGESGDYEKGSQILPVCLRIENLFDYRRKSETKRYAQYFWDDRGISDKYELERLVCDYYGLFMGEEGWKEKEYGEEEFVKQTLSGSWVVLECLDFVGYLHEMGFDGILTTELGYTNYGIFEPNQVKSVIMNTKYSDSLDIGEELVREVLRIISNRKK